MAIFSAFIAALMWIGGWIALIVSVPAASTSTALLVCGIVHGVIIFACFFWYAVFNL
jgi:hypothetical protein